jgi:glycosyltransferase involved in cell wall biosynthesis
MKNPKFSIIIPTRNRKKLLQLAIQSVLNQDYDNYEVIVHDNNSSDGTDQLVSNIKNYKLRYYRVNSDLTMHENWNKAFSYVRGDYFIRLDDDNLFCFDLLKVFSLQIAKNNYDILVGYPITLIDKKSCKLYFDTGITRSIDPYQWLLLDLKLLTDSNYVAYSTKLLEKVFSNKIIYKTSVPDRFMNLEIMNKVKDLKLKIGVTTDLVGVTRYDYERKSIDNNRLDNIDINTILDYENIEKIVTNKDCRGLNFTTHLLLNIIYFNLKNKNEEIFKFIDKNIFSKNLYRTIIQINQLNSQSKFSIEDNFKNILNILYTLILYPTSYLYGQPAYKFIFNLFSSGIRKIFNKSSLFEKKIHKTNSIEIIDTVLKKKTLHFNKSFISQNGDINDLITLT